jgi:hypothetical protein
MNITVPLHANVKQLVDVVLPAIWEMWDTEDDRSVRLNFSSREFRLFYPSLHLALCRSRPCPPPTSFSLSDEFINSAHYEAE